MFNLEQAIAAWRKQMLDAGVKSPVPMEELEIHLREEVERQVKSGMGEQQAFGIAILQIGRPAELKTEFSKDRHLKDILEIELIKKEWDLKWGPVLQLGIATGIFLICGGMVLFRLGGFAGMPAAERASSLAAIAIYYSLACTGFFGSRFFPIIASERRRLAIYAAGAVVLGVWLVIFLRCANYNTLYQFTADFLAAFLIPMGAFTALISGLENSSRVKRKERYV